MIQSIKHSLRLKIWIAIVLTTFVILALYFFVHFLIESSTTRKIIDLQGRLRAEELLNTTFHRMENLKDESLIHSFQPINLPKETLSIHITDNQNTVHFSNQSDQIGNQLSIPQERVINSVEKNAGIDSWYSTMEGDELILSTALYNEQRCQRCHDESNDLLGFAEIRFSMREIYNMLGNAQWYHMGSIVVLFIVFSLIILYMLRYVFVRRIAAFHQAMKKISEGDLKVQINDESPDEVGILARQFNTMAKEIAAARKKEDERHREELHQFDRLATIGELVSGLSHEIRNPIAGIRAAIQALSRNVPNSDPTSKIYQEIRSNADRLDTLVRSLLSYVRKEKPEPIPIQINDIIEQSLIIFENQGTNKCVIHRKLEPDLPLLNGDPKLLQQVLLNILINARQAKKSDLEITVESCLMTRSITQHENMEEIENQHLTCTTGVVQIRITDNGPGVPHKDMFNIFRPFVTTKEQGTGLGLSISTRIVREHHGCLFARNNENQNGGATFVICLPVEPLIGIKLKH